MGGVARGVRVLRLARQCLIFTKWPTWGRAVWIAAPWFTFVVVLMTLPVRPSLPQRAAFFLYFYPWAIGIALIHIANIGAARRAPL